MAQSAAKHPGKPGEGSTSRAYGLNQSRHGHEAHDWRHRRHGDDVLYSTLRSVAISYLFVKRNPKNAIPFTRKYSTLSQIEVRSGINEILSDDAAKVIDTAVENEFDACKIRYVAETTNTYTVTTNGTATKTCTSHFNQWHLKTMVDYMYQTLRCDPYDGENYMGIMTTDAMRNLYDDLESVMQYTKFPATGEVGRYYDTRFVKTNHAMSNAMGASSAYGEMYLIGKRDPVMRGVAQKLTIIPKEETDFQRSRGLAWYCIEGFRLLYLHDPSSNVMKFCSA